MAAASAGPLAPNAVNNPLAIAFLKYLFSRRGQAVAEKTFGVVPAVASLNGPTALWRHTAGRPGEQRGLRDRREHGDDRPADPGTVFTLLEHRHPERGHRGDHRAPEHRQGVREPPEADGRRVQAQRASVGSPQATAEKRERPARAWAGRSLARSRNGESLAVSEEPRSIVVTRIPQMPNPARRELELVGGAVPARGTSRRDGRAAALMIAPNLVLFTVFVVVPVVGGLLLSFTTWNITNGFPKWVGLANYRHDVPRPARLASRSRRR